MGKLNPTWWNGTLFESVKAAAESAGISEVAMSARKRYGYSSDADMKYKRPFLFRGKVYPSYEAAAVEHHYSPSYIKKLVYKEAA